MSYTERYGFFVSWKRDVYGCKPRICLYQWFFTFAEIKCIRNLHAAYLSTRTEMEPLEISSKSKDPLGVKLSAFNLIYHLPDNRSESHPFRGAECQILYGYWVQSKEIFELPVRSSCWIYWNMEYGSAPCRNRIIQIIYRFSDKINAFVIPIAR